MLQLGIPDELTRLRKINEPVLTVGEGILHQINMEPHTYGEVTMREIEQTMEEIWNEFSSSGVIETRPYTEPVIYHPQPSSVSSTTSSGEQWYTWTSPFGEIRIQRDVSLDPSVLTDSTTLTPYTITGNSGVAVSNGDTYVSTIVTASSQ